MLRFSSLRATLTRLVLAGLPAAALSCGGPDGDPCVERRDILVVVSEPPPAELAMLVQACMADPEECVHLCRHLLAEIDPWKEVDECDVTHESDRHDAQISYYVDTGAAECPIPGRRPFGLSSAEPTGTASASGAWLARAAWLEAASVHAFVGLARELGRHGAPAKLRRAALRAASDEIRHAAVMTTLARARGVHVSVPKVAPPKPRSIEALATDNVTEGCVGETWAALIARWQAHMAEDAAVRAAAAQIAEDETQHAALAWQIDRWARSRLDRHAQNRVAEARRRAVDRLAHAGDIAEPLVRELGLPDRPAIHGLFEGARATVWAG